MASPPINIGRHTNAILKAFDIEPRLCKELVITPRTAAVTVYKTKKGAKYTEPVDEFTSVAATVTRTFRVST